VEATLAARGRILLVIESDEMSDDILRNLHEVIVSLCSKLYGKRSAVRSAPSRQYRGVELETK